MATPGIGAFAHATVGVADLTTALAFWTETFGLGIRARRDGADPSLESLWALPAGEVRRQALVSTPGARAGALHLVEFAHPAPPVRTGAAATDRLPKNLDLYTRDLPARHRELEAAGHAFRSPWGEMPGPDGLRFREVHMAGHDGLNVVLLEIIGPGYDTPLSPRGYAAVGPLVTIVPDMAAESRFYASVLGLDVTLEMLLKGPAIERTVGLPPGAGLDLRVFGDPGEPLGRVEVIEYQGAPGADLYPRARPPATGILHVNYRVEDLGPVRAALAAGGVAWQEHGSVPALYGTGPVLSCRTPAGLRLEFQGGR